MLLEHSMSSNKEKVIWIDYAKGVAIFAVLIDHSRYVLYQSEVIGRATFYSVSLFILIMGVTTYISESKSENEEIWSRVKRRICKIFLPYFIATFIYSVSMDHMFDLHRFLERLLLFNASGPFYYVFLYIQLIFVNIILYGIIQRCNDKHWGWLYKILVEIGLIVVGLLMTRYSNMLDIRGGGGKLFGGTYLVLAYLGMIGAPYLIKRWAKRSLYILAGGMSALWIGILCYNLFCEDFYILDRVLLFGDEWINPPGITLICYSLVVILWCFSVGSICEKENLYLRRALLFFKIIGENSLYIFLYHRLILDYFLNPYVFIENIWIKRSVYLMCMICLPILGRKILIKAKRILL